MKISYKPIGALVGFAIALMACTRAIPPTPASEKNSHVPPAPTQKEPDPLTCNTSYTHHELTAPYRKDADNPQPIYTFAPVEFSTMLSGLGISSVCVPVGADSPYALLDWKVEDGSAQHGRMTTFSFDDWRKAQIVYATYDFIKVTEYDIFATAADYAAVRNTNTRGFERVFVGLCYGKCTVYKTFIYPFADHYVAATLDLGAYDYGAAVDTQVSKFNAGEYPGELQDDLARFDNLARGLEFTKP
jgi:hypothetical protein